MYNKRGHIFCQLVITHQTARHILNKSELPVHAAIWPFGSIFGVISLLQEYNHFVHFWAYSNSPPQKHLIPTSTFRNLNQLTIRPPPPPVQLPGLEEACKTWKYSMQEGKKCLPELASKGTCHLIVAGVKDLLTFHIFAKMICGLFEPFQLASIFSCPLSVCHQFTNIYCTYDRWYKKGIDRTCNFVSIKDHPCYTKETIDNFHKTFRRNWRESSHHEGLG